MPLPGQSLSSFVEQCCQGGLRQQAQLGIAVENRGRVATTLHDPLPDQEHGERDHQRGRSSQDRDDERSHRSRRGVFDTISAVAKA